MATASRGQGSRVVNRLSILVLSLLAIQFSSGVVLASMALPTATLSSLSATFEAYGIALALVLLVAIALLLHLRGALAPPFLRYGLLAAQAAVIALWLASASRFAPPTLRASFPVFASIAIAVTATLCLIVFPTRRVAWGGLAARAQLLLFILVPLVFALRVAASFGLGTSPGPGGVLQGNWFLVNGPTILLEYFAIGVWLSLLGDPRLRRFQARWDAWLPWIALPAVVAALFASTLFAFVLSALITWGTNLPVFVPVTLSLSLAAAAVACYLSSFVFLRNLGGGNWKPLFLGTAAILLAGFYPSAVSVAGLSYGLLATAAALVPEDRIGEP